MRTSRRAVCLLFAVLGCWLPSIGVPAADRGIGGTGAPPATGPQISDRGIGGTGIVGVITGFGSVLVDGLEVAYAPATPVTVDGAPEPGAELRVGQLVTIVASEENGLHAVSIDVRHQVSGPVTSISADGRTFVVAGQSVAIEDKTEGLSTVHPGDWVAVSGLLAPDGEISASRIDQSTPGTILVRGTVEPGAAGWRIGDLGVQPPNGASIAPGTSVTVHGTLVNGTLSDTKAEPDVLTSDPVAFFGGHVGRMVIESYVSGAGGRVRLGRGLFAAPGRGIIVPAGAHRAIVQFERGAHGEFVATHLRRARGPEAPRRVPFERGRRGALESPHMGRNVFGPPRFQPHFSWYRQPGFGHGGFMPGRRGGPR
jgi:hypothetical protein